MNTQIAIRTRQLTRDFSTVRAVDDLTLVVPAGIVFGFLGPNGSGKTTTIRLLLGLLEPTQGQAEVLGFDSMRQGDQVRNPNSDVTDLERAGVHQGSDQR